MLTITGRYRKFHLRLQDVAHVYFFLVTLFILLEALPNNIWDPRLAAVIFVVGGIGIWRYTWWLINFARSQYFGFVKFPDMRKKADQIWENGWRPSHIHFMATTFHEKKETTYSYLSSVVSEVKALGIPSTLWFGLGAKEDEVQIKKWLASITGDVPLEVVMVYQNQPGKRVAIAVTLRALSRRGVGRDEVAFLMDGDSLLTPGAVKKCVSILAAYPKIAALTTDEDVVCYGPKWVEKWLKMRFAQRRMWMQSHAVSDKVITLTGRMSAYRAWTVVDNEFIRNVEADHLEHWFWGSFRFLSGDDKSTWFTLLKNGHDMTYVPDVMVYTIEHIDGYGIKRFRDNMMRWSGNMLRNGMRAIMLGPERVGGYIWWCLIDQRIAIWTMLAGFFTAMALSLFVNHWFFVTYILWVMVTRFFVSCMLFTYSDRIRMSYPFLLYLNQILAAFIKVYLLFRLPMQSWANRMGQKAGQELLSRPFMRYFTVYMNVFAVTVMTFLVLLLTGILKWPDFYQVF